MVTRLLALLSSAEKNLVKRLIRRLCLLLQLYLSNYNGRRFSVVNKVVCL